MIEEQAGVEIGVEIHQETQPTFVDDEIRALRPGLLVLLAGTALCSYLERNALDANLQRIGHCGKLARGIHTLRSAA